MSLTICQAFVSCFQLPDFALGFEQQAKVFIERTKDLPRLQPEFSFELPNEDEDDEPLHFTIGQWGEVGGRVGGRMIVSVPAYPQTSGTVQLERAGRVNHVSRPHQQSANGLTADADSGTVLDANGVVAASEPISIVKPVQDRWTKAKQTRFNRLAAKSALLQTDENEEQELAQLQALKRRTQYPRSSEEIMREYKERKLVKQLLQAMDAYATFHG